MADAKLTWVGGAAGTGVSRKATIIRNSLSNIAMQVVAAGLPFLILPYMLRYWGPQTYGLLILAFSIQGFVQFLNGAISLTSMKYVSEIYEVGDYDRLNRVINVFWVVCFLNNLFVSTALMVVGLVGLDWLNIAPELQHTARLVFIEMSLLGVVAGTLIFIDGVMYGLQRIHQNNRYRIWESGLVALTALATMFFHGDLVQYVFAICVFPIATRSIQFFGLKKALPFLELNVFRYFDSKQLRLFSGFSAYQIVNQVADLLLYNAQKLIVQKTLGAPSLTIYEVGNKPNALLQSFISLPLSAILPACSAAYARGDLPFLERMLIMGTRVYLIVILPAMLALLLLMEPFIVLWLGRDYLQAVPVAQVFLLALMLGCPFKIFSHMMVGKARVFEYGLTKFIYAVVGIFVSLVLIRHYGIIGGVLITFGFSMLVDVPVNVYVMRSERISLRHFFGSIAPILLMLALECGLIEGGLAAGFGNTWIQFFLLGGASIAAVTLLSFFVLLRKEERELLGFRLSR